MKFLVPAVLLPGLATLGDAGSPFFFLKTGRPNFMDLSGNEDRPSWFEEATELPTRLPSTQISSKNECWTRTTSSLLDKNFESNEKVRGSSYFEEVLAPQLQTLE
jgi:hypothetical protein